MIVAAATLLPAPAPAQVVKAGVVTSLQGTATVARTAAPQPAPLKFRDDVFARDRVTTGDESLARILLGGKAVVTVRERSSLTISETATTSTIEITSGKIALAVNKERMKAGDLVEIKTPNSVAAIRGTVIIAEVSGAGAPEAGTPPAAVTSRFTLLTGVVDVSLLDPATGRAVGQPFRLNPLQQIGVTGSSLPGSARSITPGEARTISSDFRVNLRDPNTGTNQDIGARETKNAVRLTASLTGDDKGRGKGDDKGRDNPRERNTNTTTDDDKKNEKRATTTTTTSGKDKSGGSDKTGETLTSTTAATTGLGATATSSMPTGSTAGDTSIGSSGGDTAGGGRGGLLADRGIGGAGDVVGDKKNIGRSGGLGGRTGGGSGGGGGAIGSGRVGGDDLRSRDHDNERGRRHRH